MVEERQGGGGNDWCIGLSRGCVLLAGLGLLFEEERGLMVRVDVDVLRNVCKKSSCDW